MTPDHGKADYDVLIAGGGMVGASLAVMLAAGAPSIRVAMVERFPADEKSAAGESADGKSAGASAWQPSFDARATALSSGSVSIFERVGVWPQIAQHACAISTIHVSQSGHWGSTLLRAHEHALPALGHVVENAWLGRCLLARLRLLSNVTIMAPAQVTAIKPEVCGARIDIDASGEQKSLLAQLCVIADGADSALARQLGMTSRITQYEQAAIIATVATQKPHGGVAYERFTDSTPLALLPLEDAPGGEHRCALVLTLPQHELPAWRDAADDVFLKLLQRRFGQRLGRLLKVGSRSVYPLQLTQVNEQARAHIIVLGNAAHSLHPVAGQGFNLALRDAAALTEVVSGAVRAGRSCGDLAALAAWVERQRRDQQRTVLFSDGLPRLFALPQLQMVAGRVLGLVGLDLVMPAQKAFVRFASGLAEREARP